MINYDLLFPNRNDNMTFTKFWYTLNMAMQARRLPEMRYGEASDLWREYLLRRQYS